MLRDNLNDEKLHDKTLYGTMHGIALLSPNSLDHFHVVH